MILEALLSRYPKSSRVPDALASLGEIAFEAGHFREAAGLFAAVIERAPGGQIGAWAHYRLGWCHFELGEHAAAVASFWTALRRPELARSREAIARDLARIEARIAGQLQ